MNINTGKLYPSLPDAIADLGPNETADDVVEIVGDPETVERLAQSVQKVRAIEQRRAANKRARAARRRTRQ